MLPEAAGNLSSYADCNHPSETQVISQSSQSQLVLLCVLSYAVGRHYVSWLLHCPLAMSMVGEAAASAMYKFQLQTCLLLV
jgi:hypothetical protein